MATEEPSPFLPVQFLAAGCALLIILPILVFAVVALGAIVFAVPGLGPLLVILLIIGCIRGAFLGVKNGILGVKKMYRKWKQGDYNQVRDLNP